MSYHVNPKTGDPAKCRAKKGCCPFGSAEDHYTSANEASKAWENMQDTSLISVSKKTLILSDIDGTLVKTSLVLTNAVELHESGKVDFGDAPDRWKADMKNELLVIELAEIYREALSGRTVAFVKANETINRLLASDDNFYSTLKRLIEYKKQGHEVVLISGSPDFLVKPFAKRFGFKYHASTYHKDSRGRFTGEITLMAGSEAKEAVIKELGIHEYDEIIGIGDTVSDGPLLEASHQSVLVDPTDETLEILKAKNIRVDEIIRS